MDDFLDNTTNEMLGGSTYPTSGSTIAMSATAGSVGGRTSGNARPSNSGGGASAAMPSGSLAAGMVTFLALLVVVMIIAHRFGGDNGDFKNIKASFYNVIFVSLTAVVGIPVIKVAVVKLSDMGVPLFDHLATWALAA